MAKEQQVRTSPENIDRILDKSMSKKLTGTERRALRLYLYNTISGAGSSELKRCVKERADRIRDVLNLHEPANVSYTSKVSNASESQEADNTEAKVEAVIAHRIVNNVIDAQVHNWTQGDIEEPDPEVKAVLVRFAKDVARMILRDPVKLHAFGTNWREEISNAADSKLNSPEFKEFMKEAINKITNALISRFPDIEDSLQNRIWRISLTKIADYTSHVANMNANKLDPDLLLLSKEEAGQQLLEVLQQIHEKKPDIHIVISR